MSRLFHARQARLLVEACGGLVPAAEVCRVGKSQLHDYQSPQGEGFMPADVIADLEQHCGEPIYSKALFERRPDVTALRALIDECCEAAEVATGLQKAVRLAASDGAVTPCERERLVRIFAQARRELDQVGRLLEDGD